jgi:hypothetical protein
VPETCPNRFVDSIGLINKFLESRVGESPSCFLHPSYVSPLRVRGYLGIPAGLGVAFLFAISTSIVWLSPSPRVEVFGAKRIEAFRYSFNGLCYDLGNYFLRDALPQQPVYSRYDLDIRKTQHGVMLLQCSLDVLRQIFWR